MLFSTEFKNIIFLVFLRLKVSVLFLPQQSMCFTTQQSRDFRLCLEITKV